MSRNKKPRILIVEDEQIIAKNIERYIERLGYEVTGLCVSSEEALENIEEYPPDLVLMDIRIEGTVDGVELANILHKDHGIPVVFLSALMDEETLQRAKITEPFGYVVKPFSQRELHIAVEIALYKSQLERKIQDQEVLLQGLLETMQQGFCLLDREGRIGYANRELLDMLGLTSASLEHELGSWLLPQGILQSRLASGNTEPFEASLVRPDGREFRIIVTPGTYADSKGKVRGVFVSMTRLDRVAL